MAIIVVVGTYALLSLWKNTGKPVTVWYWFDRTEDASVVALAVASFLAGGVICTTALALLSATWRYRRTRAERRERLIGERREEMARKAARLRVKPPPAAIVKHPPAPPLPPENLPIIVDVRPPPAAKIERQIERIEAAQTEVRSDAIHVETHRATPFASTPAIDPRAKPPAGPEIVDEPRT